MEKKKQRGQNSGEIKYDFETQMSKNRDFKQIKKIPEDSRIQWTQNQPAEANAARAFA